MSKAIEVKDYSFRYTEESPTILENCNFTLNHGEFVLLSGLSGQGKSTLLYSLAGIIPHSIHGYPSGEIFVEEESITGKSPAEVCKQVGCVLQNADSQIFHTVVEDEIAFGCENMSIPPEEIGQRIQNACKTMDLNPSDSTRTLSGGQKQRLITASTIAMGQKILFLDEPLANLDSEGATLVLKTLRDFCNDGYAVLLAEHRIDMVLPWVDRSIYLENGQIVEVEKEKALAHMTKPIADTSLNCTTEMPCLKIQNVSYSVKEKNILKNIDFTLYQGERVVILGENGCGKTTLLQLIARMLKPTSGEILQYLGDFKKKKDWFKAVGYVYQDPGYQLFMPSVKEEIGFQVDSETADCYLRLFHLEALAEQHPQSLSEGQKRRLGIAAICANEPKVLLMDEPTVGQDYENLQNIVNAVNLVHERQKNTMVTITHDHRCASALADRALWFHKGKLYKEGGKELIEEYFSSENHEIQ